MLDTQSFDVGGIRHGRSNEIYGSVVEISEEKETQKKHRTSVPKATTEAFRRAAAQ